MGPSSALRRALVVGAVAGLAAACAHIGSRPEAQILTAESRNATVDGNPAAGGAVYATQCAACHGANGEGGFGPNLIDSAVADSYPRTVEQVREGQGAMPAFEGTLTQEEIADVSAYVHQVIRGDTAEPPLPDVGTLPRTVSTIDALGVPSAVDLGVGEETYRQNCSACHGDRGEGSTVAPPLTRPISFSDVEQLILAGRPGMPSFKLYLPAARLDTLAAYVVETFMEPVLEHPEPSGASGTSGISGASGDGGVSGASGPAGATEG
jgi:mono/diheme cytochrome c family protein